MAIFRSSLLLAALLQAPPSPPPAAAPATQADTTAALWARVRADTTDAGGWLLLGRAYLRRLRDADTATARAALDTADQALVRAAALATGHLADSARTFRLFGWGDRADLAWRRGGADAAADVWAHLPEDARLPPALEELGENLLRACPERGLLVTAGGVDTYAASYLRFVRRLRPDLTVMPLVLWGGEGPVAEANLRAAGERRPLCASMGFEQPPAGRRVRWQARPLVWVAGRTKGTRDRVPPEDFAFAALRLALDDSSSWAAPALVVYRRAVKHVPALCKAMKTFEIVQQVGCRR